MRNNGMSFFSYFIPGTSHWTSRVRLINALEESLSLFSLRKVEEYFKGPRSVAI